MRLRADIWVSAYIRRVEVEGRFATLRRRGAPEAGAIFVLVDRLDGRVALYSPGPADEESGGERRWLRAHASEWIDAADYAVDPRRGDSFYAAIRSYWPDLPDNSLQPAYAGIRRLHPSTLDGSRDKLFWFLCGWLGGPNHYIERFGHPMLRARHLPFAIASAERDAWMACMTKALDDTIGDTPARRELEGTIGRLADWMRNRA